MRTEGPRGGGSMRVHAWSVVVAGVVVGGVMTAGGAAADDGRWVPSKADLEAQRAAVPAATPTTPVPGEVWLASLRAEDPPPRGGTPPRTEPGVDVTAPRAVPAPAPVQVEPEVEYPAGGGWSPTGYYQDRRLGPASQPEWTTRRTWARVRSYVIAPGQV